MKNEMEKVTLGRTGITVNRNGLVPYRFKESQEKMPQQFYVRHTIKGFVF